MNDILHVFHHPTLRDEHNEVHRNMFSTVKKWVEEQPDRNSLNHILGSASVKAGRNHAGDGHKGAHDHGSLGGHGKTSGSIWTEIKTRDISAMEGGDIKPHSSYLSSPQPGSPAFSGQNQDFGYENRPGSGYRPNHLNPQHVEHQSHPAQSTYQQQGNPGYGQEPPSFGMPPGPPQFQQGPPPPYPNEQPQYGGGYGGYQGPPGNNQQGNYQQGGYQGGYQQGGYQQGNYQQGQPGYPGGPQGEPGYPGAGNRY